MSPLGTMREQLFQVVGQGREQHRLVGTGQPARVEPPQAVVVEQRAENRLDSTLPYPPQVLSPAALLALPGPLIGRLEDGAREAFTVGLCNAGWFTRTRLTGSISSRVQVDPAPVSRRLVVFNRQRFSSRASKAAVPAS